MPNSEMEQTIPYASRALADSARALDAAGAFLDIDDAAAALRMVLVAKGAMYRAAQALDRLLLAYQSGWDYLRIPGVMVPGRRAEQ